jgi:hypothetical protein
MPHACKYGYTMGDRVTMQRTVVELVDDLDGTELADGTGETITFSIDGVTREIDLSDKNAAKLRKALKPFVDASRRVGGTKRTRSATGSSNGDAKAIREWAIENGIELSSRGRIPAGIVEQYKSAS